MPLGFRYTSEVRDNSLQTGLGDVHQALARGGIRHHGRRVGMARPVGLVRTINTSAEAAHGRDELGD